MEKLEACYQNEGLFPETEKALLEPENKVVLLEFLKWGKLEDVAHIMKLYLARYREEFIRNRRQGVSFEEDNLLMLIALCREYPAFLQEYVRRNGALKTEYPAFLQEYVRRNGALKTEYERVLFAYADNGCLELYADDVGSCMQALLFGSKFGVFKDSLQEYRQKYGQLTSAQEDALFANADEDLLEWYAKEAGYSTDDFSFCARVAKLGHSCYLQEYIRQHYDCRKQLSPSEERRAFFFGDDNFRREYLCNFDLDLGNLVRDIAEYGGSRDAIIAQDKMRVWRLLEKLGEICREFPLGDYLRVICFKWGEVYRCTSSGKVRASSVISSNVAETLLWDTYRCCWITKNVYSNSKLENIILDQVRENLEWLLNTLEDVAHKNRKAHHLE